MVNSGDGSKAPVESKVTVAGVSATITTFIMGWILTQTHWFDSVAGALSALILAAVSGAITFGMAYWTKHTHRSDAKAQQGKHT